MKKSYVVGALIVAWAVGCGSQAPTAAGTGEPTGSTSAPIQGGTDDTTHTFAVGILVEINPSQGEVAFCSGALLAPNLVATARHCAANISSTQIDCSSASFGSDFATSSIHVTTDSQITASSNFIGVSKIITPQPTAVCGNDLALLILDRNIQLPEYVTPVLTPPMTDHSTYSTKVTAIGYGVSTPTDMTGSTAGVRRIKEDIPLQCIPNDTSFTNCFPAYQGQMTAQEFMSGDGTCEGDSGSSAYEQTSFDAGKWLSFGVLSRGGVSPDGTTCQGGVYTRFDAWASFVQQAATQAAQMGGYSPPAWVTGGSTAPDAGTGGDAGGDDGGVSTGKADGTTCEADGECASHNCVSTDGKTFVCADPCGASNSCPAQFHCAGYQQDPPGYCFPNDGTAPVSKSGGCAVAGGTIDPQPVPWRSVAAGAGLAAAAVVARRRRRKA
jgi:secreted trypsin-like serine protease